MKDKNIEKVGKRIQRITLFTGILTLILPVLFWEKIPEQIPAHYNAAGNVDRYSDKSILILILFAVALLMGIMSIAVYYVEQEMKSKYAREAEFSQLRSAYLLLVVMNFAIQCMFAYITFCSAMGKSLGKYFTVIVMAAVFGPMAAFLIQKVKLDRKNPTKNTELVQTEHLEKGIVYRSKIDWWLGLLLCGTAASMIYIALMPVITGKGVKPWTVIAAMITLLIILPLFDIKYVFYSTHLLISCGIYGKYRVEYKTIQHMKETKNPLSSAALSLDRLQIDYMENEYHKTILISPVHKKEFMKKLEQYRKGE